MDILLDTHTVLWFFEADERLSETAIETICDVENNKYVSIATLWEVAIKYSIGKLKIDGGFESFIDNIHENGFILLEVTPGHITEVANLPFIHRDPFDRMLIAQAMIENIPIMTSDSEILKYGIRSIYSRLS